MKYGDHSKAVKTVLTIILVIAAVLLFANFLLPCILPFLLAFAVAWLVEPVVGYLSKKLHIRRGIASALCIIIILLSLIGFFALVISRLIYEAVGFVRDLPELASGIPAILSKLETSVISFINKSPDGIREYMNGALEGFTVKATEIPAELSSKALAWLSGFAGSTPKIILFFATFAIGSFFISCGYPEIRQFIIRQIPANFRKTAHNIKTDLLVGLGKLLKAQLMMMCITFLELTLAFTMLGFKYAAVIAIITAVIDALPVFGTGIVLLPWATVLLISGDSPHAIGLAVTYLVVTVVRSCLEPKIVGSQFGISPAAALLAMYVGFRLMGVAGMVFFPYILMMLKQMNDKGYVRLWK